MSKIEKAYGHVDLEMMEAFTSAHGISGCEKEASRVMKSYIEPLSDEITYDHLGSLIAYKKGKGGPKLMLSGHIDEIGFVVRSIDDKGFIKLAPIGGWWGHVLLSQPVIITTRSGEKFTGIVGSKPPHGLPVEVRNKVIDVADMFVDIGVKDKDEALSLGIKPGDMVVPKSDFTVMANPNYLMAKAWDNRVGALIITDVFKNLKDETLNCELYGVGTAQEEVGLRGAKTASYKINPDVALAIDVTLANDIPGADMGSPMGKGVTLSVKDSSVLGHRGLLDYLEDLAKDMKLDVQYDMLLAGGTDSGEIHKAHDGVITLTISIPSRYIHSHRAMIHRKDYIDTVNLITEFCRRLDDKVLKTLQESNR